MLAPKAISLIYNQMSYIGKYQIIKVAMHKHEYGFWGHNGYILPIYYSCIFTISLIRFLRQTRDLLIMLPRGGQLLIGREAGEIEGHFFLSEKSPALKNTAIHQESNVKAQGSPKGSYLQPHRDFTILLHCSRKMDESTFTTVMSCSTNIDSRADCLPPLVLPSLGHSPDFSSDSSLKCNRIPPEIYWGN